MYRALVLCLALVLPCALAQRLTFDRSLYEVEEGGMVMITVTLGEAASEQVHVPFETVGASARAGRDFVAASGMLHFPPGVTEQSFEIESLDDAKFEGSETLNVVLGEPVGATLSFLGDASVRILDDDPEVAGLLEDFEDGPVLFSAESGLETLEVTVASKLAVPGQGALETVLEVEGEGRLERSFATAQNWTAFGALSFWYYGQGTGKTVTVELASGRGKVTTEDWLLVWSDEFSGPAGTPPDPAHWSFDLGDGSAQGVVGWGNDERQTYTDAPENAALDGSGNLVLTARELPEGNSARCHYGECRYSSARLHTAGKFETLYGRVEARMKLPEGQGLWPALWLLGNDYRTAGWPASGEIDVMEFIGREPTRVYGHLHSPGYSGGAGPGGAYVEPDGFSDFHIYGLEWEPNEIRWYVDGALYLTVGAEDVNGAWVFDHPFFLILNLAVGGRWPGYPDETSEFPQRLVLDYVRVYALPDSSERFSASFTDEHMGWQRVTLPFDVFTRGARQPEHAPKGGLNLREVWGYSLNVPGPTRIDQIRLERVP